MKNANLLLICLLLFFVPHLFGQHLIQEKINQNASEIEQAERFAPFEEIFSNLNDVSIPDDLLSEKQILELQEQTLNDIRTNKSEYLRLNIPIEGQNRELHLMKAEIFSPDFRLETASAPGITLHRDMGLHYTGILANTPESLVAISFFMNEISGFIAINNKHFTIGKVENSNKHILYEKNNFNEIFSFECEAIPEENHSSAQVAPPETSALAGCVRIHIEADYSLYQNKNSNLNATFNYVLALFAQTATLYANENINIDLSFLRIWDTSSPYNSAAAALSNLTAQAYGKTHGDLVHLIHTFGLGGVAYTNIICRDDINTGVSGVNGSFNNVPTYSWDVEVLTHELGHNLGSPHTHACSWNGNNTQIDDCGNVFAAEDNNPNTDPESCYNPNNQILPPSGTIMSYCHLINGVGINFNNGFGQQPGDLIRSRVNSASCLLLNCECNDGIQNGNETGIDCGGDCLVCPTCDDGILNGDELATDCGGTDCPDCPPEDCSTFDFNSGVLPFDPNQDFGTHSIEDGGATLFVENNVWKAIEINYNFTQHTVLEFDFKSTTQGEIHELSFDNDLALPTTNRIVVYGTQGYIGDYNNSPYDGNGDYTHYTFNLGFSGSYQYLVLTADDDANATGNSYFRNIKIYEDYNGDFECGDGLVSESTELDICAYLEGAYDISTESMINALEVLDILPQIQPYNQAPWNYTGTEQNDITNVVDWVLVSFRTGVESSTQIGKTAGLLQTDGCIYFPDNEVISANFDAPVYVVVEHRNHMGVMSPQALNIINGTLTWDFRAAESYKNAGSSGQKQLANGVWSMYAGDIDPSDAGYDINGADKAIWLLNNGTFNEYLPADVNQDGDVNGADKSVWFNNNGVYSIVPK